MPNPTWFERVERELVSRRLPRREVARLLTELTDHLSDVTQSRAPSSTIHDPRSTIHNSPPSSLKEDHMSMDASAVECLGSPAEIADTAVREFRRRKNLLSRSRLAVFCTFVLAPLPLLVLAWIACGAGLMGIGKLLEWRGVTAFEEGHDVTGLEVLIIQFVMLTIIFGSAAAVAAFYARLARRTSRRWLWGMTACSVLALVIGLMTTKVSYADRPGKQKSQVMVMFGVGLNGKHPLSRCWQGLLPLAVGALALRRSSKLADPGTTGVASA